ncbi:uncharacterized protein LOC142235156 [Haematobia irritans]|uniref:uncharacterized protein LOC142235156 n=1 Tax=Haematobia irritans TaxID=7368 RepID=UPI003F4FEDE2
MNLESMLQNTQRQISDWEIRSSSNHFKANVVRALTLLKLHIQNYQRIVVTKRRRALQRRRKQIIPLCAEPSALMEIVKEKTDKMFRQWEDNNISNGDDITKDQFNFFEDIVKHFTEKQWNDTFHMTRTTYNLIRNSLEEAFVDNDSQAESLIAMCIYAMATGTNFQSVGLIFNKPQTYVQTSLYRFLEAMIEQFEDQYISMPHTQTEADKVCQAFSRASHMPPCCLGVLCTFELPNYRNETGSDSKAYDTDRVIVQTLIDDRLLFRKVEVEHQSEPTMFLNTSNEISRFNGVKVGQEILQRFVVGPPMYPLRSWLMQKYENPCDHNEHEFNRALSHLNVFRELALNRLFGRWQILSSSEFLEPESRSLLAKVCCILHNIMESNGDVYCEDWSDNIDLSKYQYNMDVKEHIESVSHARAACETRNLIARLMLGDKDDMEKTV